MCALVGRLALLTFSNINIHFRFMENFKCLVWWMNFLIEQMSKLVLPGCIFILMMRRQRLSTYKLSLASLWLQPNSSEELSLPVIQKNGKSSVLCSKALIPDSQNAEIIILMSVQLCMVCQTHHIWKKKVREWQSGEFDWVGSPTSCMHIS